MSRLPGSVDEALARLLPAAGGAPHVPVFHPINLAALFAFTSGLPVGQTAQMCSGTGPSGGRSEERGGKRKTDTCRAE